VNTTLPHGFLEGSRRHTFFARAWHARVNRMLRMVTDSAVSVREAVRDRLSEVCDQTIGTPE
jgi:hypothetical protein